jgi:hypothetical protein
VRHQMLQKQNSLPPVNWRWVEEGDGYVGRLQPPGQPMGVGLPSGLQRLVPYPYRCCAPCFTGSSRLTSSCMCNCAGMHRGMPTTVRPAPASRHSLSSPACLPPCPPPPRPHPEQPSDQRNTAPAALPALMTCHALPYAPSSVPCPLLCHGSASHAPCCVTALHHMPPAVSRLCIIRTSPLPHLLEGHLVGEHQAHHHHARHPEEQDVVASLQQAGGVELGQVGRGAGPVED